MLASLMSDGNGENDENGERESVDLVDGNDLEEELSEKDGEFDNFTSLIMQIFIKFNQ